MRGRRPGKNRRRIRWNTLRIFRVENDADGHGSFAAVERSMSDRLLGRENVANEPIGDLMELR